MSRFCLLSLFLFANMDPSFSYDEDLEHIVTKQCQNYVSELILQLEEKHKIEIDSVKAQMKELTTKQAERDEKHNMEMDALRTEMKEITTKLAEADEKNNFEIHALNDKIKEISVWNNKHITESEALERNMDELNTQHVELGVQVENLYPTFHTEKDEVEVETSDGNLSSLDLSRAIYNQRVQATKSAREEYKQDNHIRHFATEHHIRRDVQHKVAFFACLSSDMNLGAEQVIVFDHIVTNIGNAYNGHNGVFSAPIGGTYVFSSTLVIDGYNLRTMYGQFIVNRQVVANFSIIPHDHASQTIVVTLNAGDDVSLKNTDINIIDNGGNSTFSRFLLYEEYANNAVVC